MPDRLVIYHSNCADGFSAAFVAHQKYGDAATFHPSQYGDPPPDVIGKDVLVVDFSYPRATLEAMARDAASILVIDHHRTAEADLRNLPYCKFDMNRSGARMTWDELFPDADVPALIEYVEDRDLWRFRLAGSKAINAFIGAVEQTFANWTDLRRRLDTSSGLADAEFTGTFLLRQIDKYADAVAPHAIVRSVAGYAVPVVNAAAPHTSELLHKLAGDAPFAVSWWERGDGKFQYSLRAGEGSAVDVGSIAKTFGGGGHRSASGFESGMLPDKLFGGRVE